MDDQRTDREGGKVRFRKLRIAWSVGWGIICVLLMGLWVRSYSHCDIVSRVNRNMILTTFGSTSGTVYFIRMDELRLKNLGMQIKSHGWRHSGDNEPTKDGSDFEWKRTPIELKVVVPTWLFIVPIGVFVTLPWLRWKFSLRTLLIATTLFALALGTIVWLTHR